ncbi:unnamed protein product [Zymoseptoria tritici ST99CH_3D1]|nr:unnamed protein product [Zymoseptoria tritici ST99CH_3D1]
MASTTPFQSQCLSCSQIAAGLQTCARCKAAKYCSRECQAAHWTAHKSACKRLNYVFKVSLEPDDFTNPPVWRTLSVPATMNFAKFHLALQTAFGWANTHSYDFGVEDPTFDPEVAQNVSLLDIIKKSAAMDKAQFSGGWEGDPNEQREYLVRIEDDEPTIFGYKVDKMHAPRRKHPRTPAKKASRTKLCDILENAQYRGHALSYTYDLGDSWCHRIEIVGSAPSSDHVICTDGHGHPVAEDAGSRRGWKEVLEAYRAARPSQEQKDKMKWFEQQASNCDPLGLKNGGELSKSPRPLYIITAVAHAIGCENTAYAMSPKHRITTAPQGIDMKGNTSNSAAVNTPSPDKVHFTSVDMATDSDTSTIDAAIVTTNAAKGKSFTIKGISLAQAGWTTADPAKATAASDQSQSVLMALPPELRTIIFEYVVTIPAVDLSISDGTRWPALLGYGIHSAHLLLWYLSSQQGVGKDALCAFAALHLPKRRWIAGFGAILERIGAARDFDHDAAAMKRLRELHFLLPEYHPEALNKHMPSLKRAVAKLERLQAVSIHAEGGVTADVVLQGAHES